MAVSGPGVEGLMDTIAKQMGALGGLLAPGADTTSQAVFLALQQQWCTFTQTKPQDANTGVAAGTTIAGNQAYTLTMAPVTAFKMKVASFYVTSCAALNMVNTNIATINLVWNNGNGGSDNVIFTGNTTNAGGGIGNIVAGTPLLLALTNTTAAIVPSGSCIQVKISKAGAGGCEFPQSEFTVIAQPSA